MSTQLNTNKYWVLLLLSIIISFLLGTFYASSWLNVDGNKDTVGVDVENVDEQTDQSVTQGVESVSFAVEGQVIALSDTSITMIGDSGDFTFPYDAATVSMYRSTTEIGAMPTPVEDINELKEATVSVTLTSDANDVVAVSNIVIYE